MNNFNQQSYFAPTSVNKLAMLYTVRDHMAGTGTSPRMPMPGPTAPNVMK